MTVDVGYGSDTINLNMAEDQQAGVDAQFTVSVDGNQIGGLQTVTASQSAGQTEPFAFHGDFTPGNHNVTVTFANNWSYPGTPGDRNLYVDGVTYDGQQVSNSSTPIYTSPLFPPNSNSGDYWGNAQYTVNDSTAVPAGTTPQQTTTPGAVSLGSGSDTLVLKMAEDAYQGDAQFTVSVDGKQIGGTQTTTALVAEGQAQEFDVHGNFGGGSHDVSVNYLNDNIGGFYPAGTVIDDHTTATSSSQWALDNTDRNLYVMGASLNGGPSAGNTPWELSSSGAQDFTVTSGGSASTANTASVSAASLPQPTSMSFLASPNTTASTASDGTSGGSSGSSGNGGGTSDLTAAVTAGGSQTAQDFNTPSAAYAPDTTSNTSASAFAPTYQDQTTLVAAHS